MEDATAAVAETGYVAGVVDRAYTEEELAAGATGYTVDDWLALNDEVGGATRFPLKNEHNEEVGRILHTYVNHEGMLCASALLDRERPGADDLWASVREKKVHSFSIGFDAVAANTRKSGKRRYKNSNFEVSLTANPVKEFATIAVRCSKTAATMSAAIPDAAAPAATPTTPTTPTPVAVPTATTPATPAPAAATMEVDPLAELAKMNPVQLARFAAEQLVARQQAEKREQAQEQAAKSWRDHEAAERERRVKEQKARLGAVAPALKAHGMDLDNPGQAALLDEIAGNQFTDQFVSALDNLAKENAALKEKAERAEREREEAARARAEQEQQLQMSTGLFEVLRGYGAKAAADDAPAAKRTPTAFNRVDARELPTESAERLGLSRLNASLFDQAAQRAIAAAQSAAPPVVPSPAAVAKADRDSEKMDMPDTPQQRLALLAQCVRQDIDPPIAVRCSKDQEPLFAKKIAEVLSNTPDMGYRQELMDTPPAFLEFMLRDTPHWHEEALRIGHNGWRFDPVSKEKVDVAAFRRQKMQQPLSMWSSRR